MPETVLSSVAAQVDAALSLRHGDPVAGPIDEKALAALLSSYDFAAPRHLSGVVDDLLSLLRGFAVRSDHPRYFGLFNPPSLPAAIAGDIVASAINPQLAVWSHAPAAAEIERKLVRLFAERVWADGAAAGTFTSGGSEANQTAVLAALGKRYPSWARDGLPRSGRRPAIYASAESHLAWIKLARAAGMGAGAVRLVASDDGLRMSGAGLAAAIERDCDYEPILVVATAGTTAQGAIDDIGSVVEVGRRHGAHVHVDAAWAGAALLHPRHHHLFAGIDGADSVTIDPHKWLSVPMGAGLYLARDWEPLVTAFGVSTGYMPSASSEHHDAYLHSVQWSRRFIGAKLFTALATLGLPGYCALIDRSIALADRLRDGLRRDGWRIVNDTTLPIVGFVLPDADDAAIRAIESSVIASGAAWISSVSVGGRLVLRACITSFESDEDDIERLLASLRAAIPSRPGG
ncbi:MAG: pyridoxal-dependent decarboxylase [Pseudomonadota bacterium]|nr:pyridoxal-dependent decarboxylase [Pseudomonadota bacterium]